MNSTIFDPEGKKSKYKFIFSSAYSAEEQVDQDSVGTAQCDWSFYWDEHYMVRNVGRRALSKASYQSLT
jgi:hypothetical protein